MFSTFGTALNWEAALSCGAQQFPSSIRRVPLKNTEKRFRRTPKRKTAKLRKELLEALALKVPFRRFWPV
jgi:hypothetical protein